MGWSNGVASTFHITGLQQPVCSVTQRKTFWAVTLRVNVKQGIWLDTRLVFYVNTGVMMYMNPTQTSCLKLSLAKPGVSASNLPPHLPLRRLVCIAVSACKYLTQKDWQYVLVKKRTSFCSRIMVILLWEGILGTG